MASHPAPAPATKGLLLVGGLTAGPALAPPAGSGAADALDAPEAPEAQRAPG